jgi:hypothetical protein
MKTLFLLACALLASSSVYAAPPSKESIDRLLKASNVEETLATTRQQVDQMMRGAITQSLKNQNAGPEAEQVAATFSTKVAGFMSEEMSWEKMRAVYQQVYAESFTQEEIDGLIAFYESKAGKAFVTKMPVVMQKSMTLMQERLAPMMQRLQQSMQETLEGVNKAK